MRIGSAALRAAIATSGVAAMTSGVAAQTLDEKAVALEWIAPAECPDMAYVDREIARLLAGDPVPAERRLRARAEVAHAGGVWRVRIRTSGAGGAGDRSLDAESCRALADATALIVALAVDPARVAVNRAGPPAPSASSAISVAPSASSAVSLPPAPSSAATIAPSAPSAAPSAPPPAPPAAPPARPTPAPRSSSDDSPPTELAAALGAEYDRTTLPRPTAGGFLAFGVLPGAAPWLRLDLRASIFAGASTGAGTALGGDFAMRALDGGACFLLLRDVIELAPCVGVDVAWIAASGNGETSRNSGTSFMPSVRFGLTLAVRVATRLYLRLDLAGLAALARPEFVAGGVGGGLVHEPAALTARAALGLELRF